MAWPPSHGQDGWVDIWECQTPDCTYCPYFKRQAMEFSVCKPVGTCGHLWVIHICDIEDNYVSREYYSRWPCKEESFIAKYTFLNGCTPNQFGGNGQDFLNRDICGAPGTEVPNSWVTAKCGLVPPEFRKSELSDNAQMNVGIVIIVLLFVFMIGVISGYLVYRKKKKSAEKEKFLLRQSMQRHATETL